MKGPVRISAVYVKPSNRPNGRGVQKAVVENGQLEWAEFALAGFAYSLNENASKLRSIVYKYARVA